MGERYSDVGEGWCRRRSNNAKDNVKAAADYIAPSVDEDGVAEALRHFSVIA
ncbi:MAG: HAD family hydrolase [Merdibacter sp.]